MTEDKNNINTLKNIDGSFASYKQLIELFQINNDVMFSTIFIALHQWFAANMSAALGAILDKLQDNFNTIEFKNVQPNIEKILQKNNFLYFFNYPSVNDSYNTTIPYLKLKPTDGKFFNNYVFTELLGRGELPEMSDGARNKIAESIYDDLVKKEKSSILLIF